MNANNIASTDLYLLKQIYLFMFALAFLALNPA